jgi:hypothetical protein
VTAISPGICRTALISAETEKMRIAREGLRDMGDLRASAVTCVTVFAAESNCLNGDKLALPGHFSESPNPVVLVRQGNAQKART